MVYILKYLLSDLSKMNLANSNADNNPKELLMPQEEKQPDVLHL